MAKKLAAKSNSNNEKPEVEAVIKKSWDEQFLERWIARVNKHIERKANVIDRIQSEIDRLTSTRNSAQEQLDNLRKGS